MSPKFALVFWPKTQKISIVSDGSIVKSFEENGSEIPVCEGATRMLSLGNKRFEVKILRICSSKKYLESLLVTKDGEVLLHGSKPQSQELLAKRSNLQDEVIEGPSERNALQQVNLNSEEHEPKTSRSKGATECCHGCPSCCSGNLPPFPTLPDGFVSTLVSLAEYFQQFQTATADKVKSTPRTDMSNHLNTWQWASREKVELNPGADVWIDAIKLEKIMGQANITKKPPHQTLVKSLLLDLMGTERYIDTSAERMDRRLISAVIGFANTTYPELAQPIERYYRCINLNRGYLQKRRNEGASVNLFDKEEYSEEPAKSRKARTSRKSGEDFVETKAKRKKKYSRTHEDLLSKNSSSIKKFNDLDRIIIPLDGENDDDLLTVPRNNIQKVIIVQANSKSLPKSESTKSVNSVPITTKLKQPSDALDVSSGDEDSFLNYDSPNIKNEEDLGHIDGALDISL